MTSRSTAVLVIVAVLAGAVVAGVGLATRGSGKPARVLQIDEQTGRVGKVVLGETRAGVLDVLGRPTKATAGLLLYRRLTVRLREGLVVSISTDDPAARSDKVVVIGDPLSAVRASYRGAAHCNPNAPDKNAAHPRCRVRVPAGTLSVEGDPIRLMTLGR